MSSPSLPARLWHSPYTFWLILALPALPMMAALWDGSLRGVLHPSGEFSARFLIISLMLTPLVMLFPQNRAIRWLMKRRRHIGVAAFLYGALHTLAYVLKAGALSQMIAELPRNGIWTGWLAFLLFLPLAITSNDFFLRLLAQAWKRVQQLAYPAALLTLAHWVFESHGLGGIIVHFLPLTLLEIYRIGWNLAWWGPKARRLAGG
jgi:sulfoxide reductase heme-binding subunit YedZ